MGNIATGLLAGWNMANIHQGKEPVVLPGTTVIGSLCHYITHASAADFQPMKANFGILPALGEEEIHGKRQRGAAYSARALKDLEHALVRIGS
jgi:methylenetetrahydrofolate--tRNA-(uracil-5-)-methyltransferase